MNEVELKQILQQGEDSKHQFKQSVENGNALAAEMVAFSNSLGGKLFIGVNDEGEIIGVPNDKWHNLNQLIANTASQSVRFA